MPYTIHQMKDDDPQWEELFRVMVLSFEQPLQGMFRLFRPLLEDGPEADEASFQEFQNRMRYGYGGGPECTWQKVVNEEGVLVACALWKIYDSDPFAVEEDETVFWYPEGPQRDFVSAALERFDAPRAKWGKRPQVFLNILAVHPNYQRQSIGKQILSWGVEQADSLNREMWLDASPYGKGLYEQFGFTTLLKHDISPPFPEGQDEKSVNPQWLKLKTELGEMVEFVMWRPKGGAFVEGNVRPCDEAWATQHDDHTKSG